eukprot:9091103-Pyramimonas_sp.AAC.1
MAGAPNTRPLAENRIRGSFTDAPTLRRFPRGVLPAERYGPRLSTRLPDREAAGSLGGGGARRLASRRAFQGRVLGLLVKNPKTLLVATSRARTTETETFVTFQTASLAPAPAGAEGVGDGPEALLEFEGVEDEHDEREDGHSLHGPEQRVQRVQLLEDSEGARKVRQPALVRR